MTILAIDTSSPKASVAINNDGNIFVRDSVSGSQSHNEEIAGLVESVINDAKLSFSNISMIVLGAGPGSFTGLRIGYAFVQGLAQSRDVPVRQCCSFLAIANSIKEAPQKFRVAASAGKDLSFVASYSSESGKLAEKRTPELISAALLKDRSEAGPIFSTEAATLDFLAIANSNLVSNLAAGLLRAVAAKNPQEMGKSAIFRGALELAQLTPNYIREVAAKTIAQRA